jgi:crotonobetainyl-CoA:carnitine CoA-transferase CaiB-like acyl-CoA transferase
MSIYRAPRAEEIDRMTMPLEGIRVVDWTIWQQGPVASVMLGDLGAEVIKVEERIGGDPGRGVLRAQGLDLSDRPNFYFEANNRNKKSIALDLKKPEGVAIVQRLTERADVFVQNFRKGVAGRLGLDAATLRARNPRLIYASATGYGPEGPESGAPSFDYLGLARSGIMFSAGEPDDEPLAIAGGIADQMGAVMLAYGVLAALFARERTGRGQEVDASHLGSMAWLQGLGLSARLMLDVLCPASPGDSRRTRSGITIAAPTTNGWRSACSSRTATGRSSARCSIFPKPPRTSASRPCSSA